MQLVEFKAQVEAADDTGGLRARIVPYGEPAPHGPGRTVQFERGGLSVPDGPIPLTVDHGDSVLDVVGSLVGYAEDDTGAYASFEFAATTTAQDVRALLAEGIVADVSIGVDDWTLTPTDSKTQTMSGVLDHVSIVNNARWSQTAHPSKVLAVHSTEEDSHMDPVTDTTPAPELAPVAVFDDGPILKELAEMRDDLDAYKPAPAQQFTGLQVFAGLMERRFTGKVANHALADVIGDLGSADASGIVPDFYWAGGLQHLTDRRRPLFATLGSAPFPTSGNNLTLPRVTQSTDVSTRAAEKGAANSQALQAVLQTFPIQWFDGAVDVALEIIAQSDPSVLSVISEDMLAQYAIASEADATTRLAAIAIHAGAALDTTTYATLVADLVTTSNLIEDATGAPGDICGVTPAQWIAILSLMDGGDRRQFAMTNPSNADGSGSLVTRGIDVGGIFVYRAPAATTALQYNQDSAKAGERNPVQVQATNVELMGRDVGILGATVIAHWAAGVYSYEIV